MYLPSPSLSLSSAGRLETQSTNSIVEQRHAHFQAVRHAGAIDLGENVARQIGLEVEVLHERQRMLGRRVLRVTAKHFDRAIALKPPPELRAEQARARVARQQRHAVQIGLQAVAAERLQQSTWRAARAAPSRASGRAPGESEHRCAHRMRQHGAHALLVTMPAIAPIAREVLVAAVARTMRPSPAAAPARRRDRSAWPSCRRRARRRSRPACR